MTDPKQIIEDYFNNEIPALTAICRLLYFCSFTNAQAEEVIAQVDRVKIFSL